MPSDIKLTGKSLEQRLHDRLLNSGAGANPDLTVTKGSGPTRVHTNLHHSPGSKARGAGGEPTKKPLIPTP